MSTLTKTTILLPRADYARLKALSRRERRPVSELVREAVAQYADRRVARRVPRSIGSGRSRRGDVAARADELLEGIGRR